MSTSMKEEKETKIDIYRKHSSSSARWANGRFLFIFFNKKKNEGNELRAFASLLLSSSTPL